MDLAKVVIFLEREKGNIVGASNSLSFEGYPYNQNPLGHRQWVIIDLNKFGKEIVIRFYVSSEQVRFLINGVELNGAIINPYKEDIVLLSRFFKNEWERRQLQGYDQF